MDDIIQNFVEHKKIGIVGASRKGGKFGNAAAKELIERGYEIFIVHPEAEEIDGILTYPNLAAIKDQTEYLIISVPSARAESVLREASAAGISNIWLQQGAESPGLMRIAEDLDLDLVSGKCILMYAEPVRSFHKFHQIIWKLIGQY